MAELTYKLNSNLAIGSLSIGYCEGGPHNIPISVRSNGSHSYCRVSEVELQGLLRAGILEELQPEMPPGLL